MYWIKDYNGNPVNLEQCGFITVGESPTFDYARDRNGLETKKEIPAGTWRIVAVYLFHNGGSHGILLQEGSKDKCIARHQELTEKLVALSKPR